VSFRVAAGSLLLLACLGLGARVWQSDLRPMHHDEANQALKFADLLERGEYAYDPAQHHGPTLYLLTLPFVRPLTAHFPEVTEGMLRSVPALFGAACALLLLLLRGWMTPGALVASGLLCALSPGLVYYGRFYIQEMLFCFFSFGLLATGARYAAQRTWRWAALAGLFAGLTVATKETWVLTAFALAVAVFVSVFLLPRGARRRALPGPGPILLFSGVALLTVALFYSTFFTQPAVLLELGRSVSPYVDRAAGGGHAHPWHYYLSLITAKRTWPFLGPEWFAFALALFGGFIAIGFNRRNGTDMAPMRRENRGDSTHPKSSQPPLSIEPLESMMISRGLPREIMLARFVAIYVIVLLGVYSAIPYKTPWCIVTPLFGIVLLAGIGADGLWRRWKHPAGRALLAGCLAAGLGQTAWASYQLSFVKHSDASNPYAYVQTSTDLANLLARVDGLAAAHPGGRHLLIAVIAAEDEIWPLPWYFRSYDRVGYWSRLPEDPRAMDAPILITSSGFGEPIPDVPGKPRVSSSFGLREGVFLTLRVERSLWERFLSGAGASNRP
jgi:uncharacterized protein (TIGR03663 family)